MQNKTSLFVAAALCCASATTLAQSSAYSYIKVTQTAPCTTQLIGKDYSYTEYQGTELRAGVIKSTVNAIADDIPSDAQPIDDVSLVVKCTDMYGRVEDELTEPETLYAIADAVEYGFHTASAENAEPRLKVYRGGRYTYQATFPGIGYDYTTTVDLLDDPSVRLHSSTSEDNDKEYSFDIHFNTGYPYDASQFTGNEKARVALYAIVGDTDEAATELASEEKQLSLCRPDQPLVAAVDTISLKPIILTPGYYCIAITSDWKLEDANSFIYLEVKDTEAAILSAPKAKLADDKACYDLQGRKLTGLPATQGLRIQSRRKVLTK